MNKAWIKVEIVFQAWSKVEGVSETWRWRRKKTLKRKVVVTNKTKIIQKRSITCYLNPNNLSYIIQCEINTKLKK